MEEKTRKSDKSSKWSEEPCLKSLEGPHWWVASALTTAPPLFSGHHFCSLEKSNLDYKGLAEERPSRSENGDRTL